MDGVVVTDLKQINHPKGDIFHGMKSMDETYFGFGEAYFSNVHFNEIKGWKKHTKMVLNLIVPVGSIEFIIYDEINNEFFNIILSSTNYKRLTILPNLWVAFKGISKEQNLLLNIASIEHDPDESDTKRLDEINYEW